MSLLQWNQFLDRLLVEKKQASDLSDKLNAKKEESENIEKLDEDEESKDDEDSQEDDDSKNEKTQAGWRVVFTNSGIEKSCIFEFSVKDGRKLS